MPWRCRGGRSSPAEAPARSGSPIRQPFPDILIASGRRAVPYVRTTKRASGGRTFTVVLKDPHTGVGAADLIWVPEHDRLRGANVITSLTAPHRVTAAALRDARHGAHPGLDRLARPRVAVLVGGDSRHHRFTAQDCDRLERSLVDLQNAGASLMATTSRRTPPRLADAVRKLTARHGDVLWEGEGENPYLAMLALADAVVVTADSTNMVGEAVATGAPVLVFSPSGGHAKITSYLKGLEAYGAVKPFVGRLEDFSYQPLDMTPSIAAAVGQAFEWHRAALAVRS